MFTYTIVCFGAEIGSGEGSTFEEAKRDAESSVEHSAWYPRSEWGFISVAPNGMTVTYNVD